MAFKGIFGDSLKIGMYVTRLDCPWYRSPFLKHRFLIRSQSQLDKLKRSGIQEVTIDSSRGLDIETPPHIAASDEFLASSRPPDHPENRRRNRFMPWSRIYMSRKRPGSN
ncbi:MAG: DUF3391 domain-containing protein [Nitrospiraceae bacterium]|nr:DUF3391 domain-containing protein [Nitrospiraceae bacterium]